jgi:NNP family nitrate/nitrite transporter-like MFS transporter
VGVPAVAVFAVALACPMMATFTAGALGLAAAIGLGNGAVFKLVPQHFPGAVASATGLVGAAGGLGGFFPPLVLGVIRQATGSFTRGFVLLGVSGLVCLAVLRATSRRALPGGLPIAAA